MNVEVDVNETYRSEAGYRENASWSDPDCGGPIWSVVTAGPARAGELVRAAMTAVVQLGNLTQYITLVKLSFEKPALVDAIVPHFVVSVAIPSSSEIIEIVGLTGGDIYAPSSGPFPKDRFINAMVREVRYGLARDIGKLRASLAEVEESLTFRAQ